MVETFVLNLYSVWRYRESGGHLNIPKTWSLSTYRSLCHNGTRFSCYKDPRGTSPSNCDIMVYFLWEHKGTYMCSSVGTVPIHHATTWTKLALTVVTSNFNPINATEQWTGRSRKNHLQGGRARELHERKR